MYLSHIINFLNSVNELETSSKLLNTFYKYSHSIEQLDELAKLYNDSKLYEESYNCLKRCEQLASNSEQLTAIYSNLSKLCNSTNRCDETLWYTNQLLQHNPNNYNAVMEQALAYYFMGNYSKSFELQEQLYNNPNITVSIKNRIRYNLSTKLLYDGDFKKGLHQMITCGKSLGIWKPLEKPFPRWNGGYTDATVLVYAEAGIGDQIINSRFMFDMPNAIWIGGDDSLRAILARHGINVLESDDTLDYSGHYVYTESGYLPVLLDVDLDALWKKPYLNPDSVYINKWKNALPENFITIRWSGNPQYEQDLHRSVPFNSLYTIVSKTALPIISLQVDDTTTRTEKMIRPEIKSWEDTIAIQYLAALNITSCTSTAHSASAIGARTIVLPPIATYYPWISLTDKNTSSWYGETTKVIPQTQWKDWEAPLQILSKEIEDAF